MKKVTLILMILTLIFMVLGLILISSQKIVFLGNEVNGFEFLKFTTPRQILNSSKLPLLKNEIIFTVILTPIVGGVSILIFIWSLLKNKKQNN
ncbi:hypothetical protein P344_06540 [Spiroplasma mirum ATCC 29335]|uniref:Uncharacterized protein n=1 Tax=Spiroplasma mirum ATCC 29335 TaxID=838561 RepID=W0GMI8_9MOLU|nr:MULTISPECIES: hypothetical protein [Spiroplasma]AHF61470.1 hypothetical protein SMM_1099 [Spiroplasma mirum ATCC 29335]AHI58609.1 hypothetical protein P344_06540 [Spiroplasma mirum ATCC 29335]AKM53513.1 hypothetical protein SATRI_v1c11670 [Spiroplasma atrichopogonis]